RVALLAAPQFTAGNHELFFGTAMEDGVIFRMTPHPSRLDECIGRTSIERIITDRNLLILHHRNLEAGRPVINMVDLYSTPRHNLSRAPRRGRERSHQELLIIRNHALGAGPGRLESGPKRFPKALTQGWVVDRVVHLEQVLR